MIYALIIVLVYCIHLALKLNWIATGILGVYLLIMLRFHTRYVGEKKRQEVRFRDASLYMDTLLYAFVKDGKIMRAFEDVKSTLPDGELKSLVSKALDNMMLSYGEDELLDSSFRIVELNYKCSRIQNIHSFMAHVEQFGGDIEQAVNLLLDDKNRWERRIIGAKEERNHMFVQVVLSVIASLIICGVIQYLPVLKVDISSNILVQCLGVGVVIIDELIILRAQKKLCVDWLILDVLDEEEYYEKKMKEYKEYDKKRDMRTSILLSLIPVVMCAVSLYFKSEWALGGSLLLLLLFMNQHRIGRGLAKRNLEKYIRSAFPKWLLDIALLLQSENVHMALIKSKEQVPAVLKEELNDLVDRIELDPEEAMPYHAFLSEFDLSEVHSALGMLYALSMGNSANAQRQVGELISRNLEMLDVADKARLHDKNSGMYLLFLAPVLTASFKLVIDMAVFLLLFLSVSVV